MKKGISLAVLVVTIIVLVILTAATVATISGQNGVIDEARSAVSDAKKAQAEETVQMELSAIQIKAAKKLQTAYEFLVDPANFEVITDLDSKGIALDLTSANVIKCTYSGYEINANSNGQVVQGITDLTGTIWKITKNEFCNDNNANYEYNVNDGGEGNYGFASYILDLYVEVHYSDSDSSVCMNHYKDTYFNYYLGTTDGPALIPIGGGSSNPTPESTQIVRYLDNRAAYYLVTIEGGVDATNPMLIKWLTDNTTRVE